ncbi:MAG: hypothetical protein Q9201_005743 [Fulgogasparrea decipioides]
MAIQKPPFSSTTTADGKVILFTGASKGGLGAETAVSLATANPKKIILTGCSEAKVAPALEQTNPGIAAQFIALELGDQQSVRKVAAKVNAIHPGLIISSNLMNNVSQEMFMDD